MQLSRMRLSRIGMVAAVLALTAGTALAERVTADYNREANFSHYKTFMWIKEPRTANPLMRQRVMDDVNAVLKAKGLRLVTADADLGVAAHAATKEEKTLNTFYDGFGGWRWRWGGPGEATTTVQTYEVGTLVVDLFDTNTKEAVFRATASRTLSGNPDKNTKNLNEAIDKMFKNFPPSEHRHGD
jgi:Domain of unknown function (DUF4136)